MTQEWECRKGVCADLSCSVEGGMLLVSAGLGLQCGMLSTKVSRTNDSNGKYCELLFFAGYCRRYFECVLSSCSHEKQVPSVSLPFTDEKMDAQRGSAARSGAV